MFKAKLVEKKAQGKPGFNISTPTSKGNMARIFRDIELLQGYVENKINHKEFSQSLVFSISLAEDYIVRCMIRIIRAYPQKLGVSAKGRSPTDSSGVTIELADLLKTDSINSLIAEKADIRVRDAMYAKPAQYHKYIESIFGFKFSDDVWNTFIEIKATRDIIIHANGIVNDIYVEKSGAQARFQVGSQIEVDNEYFKNCMTCIKRIYEEIYENFSSKYVTSKNLEAVIRSDLEKSPLSSQTKTESEVEPSYLDVIDE